MKNKSLHCRVEGCLAAAGLPVSAMIFGWFFGSICAFCFMLVSSGGLPDVLTGLLVFQFCFVGTLLHPSFWVYCALSVAWATISNNSEPLMGIVCDFLFLLSLIIIFALSFGVKILEPDFVEDFVGWLLILATSSIIVSLSILARSTLTRLQNQAP